MIHHDNIEHSVGGFDDEQVQYLLQIESLSTDSEGELTRYLIHAASLGNSYTMNNMTIEEDSEVLSLMLHFMHKQPQPDLQQVQIGVLVRLAEAAEKYLIYSAMSICRVMIG